MTYAPVALFVYKRLEMLNSTVQALATNAFAEFTDLYFFSDGPKDKVDEESVKRVRNYLETVKGFRSITIINRSHNIGLSNNILEGVSRLLSEFDKIIVLEDDIVTSPYFLEYMNCSLDMYEDEDSVCQICAYSYLEESLAGKINETTYFIKGSDCLAWGTWRSSWTSFMTDPWSLLKEIYRRKKIKSFNRSNSYNYFGMLFKSCHNVSTSWAVRFYAINFLLNRYTLYPVKSLALHTGNDHIATNYRHSRGKDPLYVPLSVQPLIPRLIPIREEGVISSCFNKFLEISHSSRFWRLRIFLDMLTVPMLASIKSDWGHQ